jgi:UDP-N-acetylmuramoyl-tripeptide--D-alanyl-D-alanine ligase
MSPSTAMRAAFAVLDLAAPAPGGRRIAVLGDMLELGEDAPALHAALAEDLAARRIDRVDAAGPNMAHLFAALPAAKRGAHAADSAALAPVVAAAVRPGDVVLVKGSLGMNMARIVQALADRSGAASTEPQRRHG